MLPDGVADVLFDDAQKQEVLRHELTQQLITYGYQLVCPPMIEFTESLLSDASEDLKRQTFKIIDQLTGRLMGVRADITPQILRIDAHHGARELPVIAMLAMSFIPYPPVYLGHGRHCNWALRYLVAPSLVPI